MMTATPATIVQHAWASLARWHQCGEPLHRLSDAEVDIARTGLPLDLQLATAAIRAPGLLYRVGEREWLIVARHGAAEPYPVPPGAIQRGFESPTLTYVTEVGEDGDFAAGVIGLRMVPTPAQLRVYPGNRYTEMGTHLLDRDEYTNELIRLGKCLPHFYCKDSESSE